MNSNTKNLHMWILYSIIIVQAHPSNRPTIHIILTLNFTYTVPHQLTLIAPMSCQTQERSNVEL